MKTCLILLLGFFAARTCKMASKARGEDESLDTYVRRLVYDAARTCQMASKAREEDEIPKIDMYVRRLVYDVMMYTLPKCGLAETELPSTDSEVNVYNRANFVEVAGLSTLRVSLLLRDRWKRMFLSRRKSLGFTKKNIAFFLQSIVLCCPLSWVNTSQSVVEASLAVVNEIVMFFHHEGIVIDFNIILDSICTSVKSVIAEGQNASEAIEGLFGKFDNISEYTRWITDFIANFAIPYGSKDVSVDFFEYVRKKFHSDSQVPSFPEKITLTELRDYLGFLPDDLFYVIAYEESTDLPEKLPLDSESTVPSDQESSKPQKLPPIPESGAVGGEESHGSQSTESANVSEETTQGKDSSKSSLELKLVKDLEQMTLDSEGFSWESPKRKKYNT